MYFFLVVRGGSVDGEGLIFELGCRVWLVFGVFWSGLITDLVKRR